MCSSCNCMKGHHLWGKVPHWTKWNQHQWKRFSAVFSVLFLLKPLSCNRFNMTAVSRFCFLHTMLIYLPVLNDIMMQTCNEVLRRIVQTNSILLKPYWLCMTCFCKLNDCWYISLRCCSKMSWFLDLKELMAMTVYKQCMTIIQIKDITSHPIHKNFISIWKVEDRWDS